MLSNSLFTTLADDEKTFSQPQTYYAVSDFILTTKNTIWGACYRSSHDFFSNEFKDSFNDKTRLFKTKEEAQDYAKLISLGINTTTNYKCFKPGGYRMMFSPAIAEVMIAPEDCKKRKEVIELHARLRDNDIVKKYESQPKNADERNGNIVIFVDVYYAGKLKFQFTSDSINLFSPECSQFQTISARLK